MMKNKIILIGGAPTAGKSFIARKLSEELELPWISTDTIRGFMKEMVKKADYPQIFYFAEQDPGKYLNSATAQKIAEDQNKESYEVWSGVRSFIKTEHSWKSFIIEGVAILPYLIKRDYSDNASIKPFFILDNNLERIRKVIYERGLWANAREYSDNLKEKEIEWVIAFNNWLENELRKYNYPVIKYANKELDIKEIKKIFVI